MPLRHYKAFYDSVQLVLYSFFWRRLATGVLAFCSLLPSPPVQWKICSLTPFIKITLVSSSDVSLLGHGRKLHLYTKLGKELHLPSFFKNFILIRIHFRSFQLFWPLKKAQNQPTTKPLCHTIVMSSTSSSLWWSHYWDPEHHRELCWWYLEPFGCFKLCRNHPKEDGGLVTVSFACCGRVV